MRGCSRLWIVVPAAAGCAFSLCRCCVQVAIYRQCLLVDLQRLQLFSLPFLLCGFGAGSLVLLCCNRPTVNVTFGFACPFQFVAGGVRLLRFFKCIFTVGLAWCTIMNSCTSLFISFSTYVNQGCNEHVGNGIELIFD